MRCAGDDTSRREPHGLRAARRAQGVIRAGRGHPRAERHADRRCHPVRSARGASRVRRRRGDAARLGDSRRWQPVDEAAARSLRAQPAAVSPRGRGAGEPLRGVELMARRTGRSIDPVGAHLVRADAAFKPLIAAVGPVDLRDPSGDPFNALLRAIVFQQLAGRAATAIHGRVVALFDGGVPTPAAMLATRPEKLRAAGLPANKQAAVVDLAAKFADGTIPTHDFAGLTDDEVIARLVQVRGVGPWTAEMFLMFELHRPDVWPVDDFGVRAGWKRLHHLADAPKPKELMLLGEPFRPYRSAVAWYLWRAVDTVLPD